MCVCEHVSVCVCVCACVHARVCVYVVLQGAGQLLWPQSADSVEGEPSGLTFDLPLFLASSKLHLNTG